MAHYDLDHAACLVDPDELFAAYVKPVADRIHGRTFEKMIRTVDQALANLKPSQSSRLTWTRCAALIGHKSYVSTPEATNHLWDAADTAVTFDPDGANKFVGSLIMWRISLLPDTWLSAKTKDAGGVHPYRGYWINNKFIPHHAATPDDLAAKMGARIVRVAAH